MGTLTVLNVPLHAGIIAAVAAVGGVAAYFALGGAAAQGAVAAA